MNSSAGSAHLSRSPTTPPPSRFGHLLPGRILQPTVKAARARSAGPRPTVPRGACPARATDQRLTKEGQSYPPPALAPEPVVRQDGSMDLLRSFARPMLATSFIFDGLDVQIGVA